MKFMKLLETLEKYSYSEGDLDDLEITANKIGHVSFLLIKDTAQRDKVIDCIILKDHRHSIPIINTTGSADHDF